MAARSDCVESNKSKYSCKENSEDSGIEDNIKDDDHKSKGCNQKKLNDLTIRTDILHISNTQPTNGGGVRKRGNIWGLFSRKSKKSSLKSKQSSYSSPNHPVFVNTTPASSQTSDLGDSIPSTPVSTISSGFSGFAEIPGIVGLDNLGNTCYFNAVIQCLSHIDLISEYFGLEHFMSDLARSNRDMLKGKSPALTTSNNNEMGQLTYMIGLLIKSIWNSDIYTIGLLQEVMEVVRFYNKHYSLHEQQDALEFFMWLINRIHTECATSLSKKKSLKGKDMKKRKQQRHEEQAVLSFASFTKYKRSYIQGLFLSQYQSTIKCSKCEKHSSTFDPYISLSLDIPSQPKQFLYTTVVWADPNAQAVRYGFEVQRKGTLHELRNEIVDHAGINKFVIMEIKTWGIERILRNDNPLSILPKDDNSLYAVEVNKRMDKDADIEGNMLVLVVSNVERKRKQNIRFGLPTVLQTSDSLNFQQIQCHIRKVMKDDVREHLINIIKQNRVRLGLRIITDNNSNMFLSNDVEYPLRQPNITKCMEYDDNLQMNCLYLVAEWESSSDVWSMGCFTIPAIINDVSCNRAQDRLHDSFTVDLHDCLRMQTKEERLNEVGLWRCPSCHHEQKGIIKQMTLWSLPDVLVLHLKRFDQVQHFNNKSTTFVRFPIKGLDLSPYLASLPEDESGIKQKYYEESLKMEYQPPPVTEKQCCYDLRAVCNHHGSDLNHGHYTSVSYNSVNDTWYHFDDRKVLPVPESSIESKDAYLLFYQRRELSSRVPEHLTYSKTNVSECFAESHWSFQMNGYNTLPRTTLNLS